MDRQGLLGLKRSDNLGHARHEMEVLAEFCSNGNLDYGSAALQFNASISTLKTAFKNIAGRNEAVVSFADTYHAAYNLLLYGKACYVYHMALVTLRKLSRARDEEEYARLAQIICDICGLVNDKFALAKGLAAMKQVATYLYERPVAARWRRVRRVVRWMGYMRAWLPAYNEIVHLRPGGKIARQCESEFYSLA